MSTEDQIQSDQAESPTASSKVSSKESSSYVNLDASLDMTTKDGSTESWFANTDEYQAIEGPAPEKQDVTAKRKVNLPSLPCDLDVYCLTSLRAEGGTARVYRAFETHSKQPIAIKLLRRRFHSDELIKTVFMRHGKALSQVNLPHFHQVIDSGDSPWGPWWAMNWVEGETLTQIIKQGIQWKGTRLITLMSQLCDALIGLHTQDIIHGDLTPDNVIYHHDPRSGQEQLTLIDLALPIRLYREQEAKEYDSVEQSILAFGQPAYMAPECLKGDLPTSKSDLYGLGLLFFELCTGTPVYRGAPSEFLNDLLEKEAPTASSRQSPWPYPSSLDALISHLLSKNPQNRTISILEVKEQLQAMLQFLIKSEQHSKTEEFSSALLSQVRDEVQSILENKRTEAHEIQSKETDSNPVIKSSRTSDTLHVTPVQSTLTKLKTQLTWMVIGMIFAYLLSIFL